MQSKDMFQLHPCDILRYDLFQGEFQPDIVKSKVLDHLTTQNLRVNLLSYSFADEFGDDTNVGFIKSAL